MFHDNQVDDVHETKTAKEALQNILDWCQAQRETFPEMGVFVDEIERLAKEGLESPLSQVETIVSELKKHGHTVAIIAHDHPSASGMSGVFRDKILDLGRVKVSDDDQMSFLSPRNISRCIVEFSECDIHEPMFERETRPRQTKAEWRASLKRLK
jgi:hypothetical protein